MWPRVTREVAEDLAVDAITRDRAGKPPFDELARLREAGLPALLTPPGPHGRGTDWRTACAVIREIAAADSSIGELLGRHHVLSWSARFFGTPEQAEALELRTAGEQWVWGGSADIPGAGPESAGTDPELTLTPAPDGYVLHGRRTFASGVAVADRLLLGAVCTESGEALMVVVDPAHPASPPTRRTTGSASGSPGPAASVSTASRCDRIRCSASSRATSTTSPRSPRSPRWRCDSPSSTWAWGSPKGTGRGAGRQPCHAARLAARGAGRRGYDERPGSDPYLLLAYGELVAAAHTAAAVVEPATEALTRGLLAGRGLGVDERADIAVLVAAAEAVTSRAALQITTRVLELTGGADSLADDPGFDRFWRNARVLTAQGSSTHRLRDIGDHYLNGTHPPLTLRA
ncbi:acyl-CoA dehydrogenase family protein [Streptomyces lydicus]|nr:acyl-CoA dehydrogenase family protein [Streptomyces lydicus]